MATRQTDSPQDCTSPSNTFNDDSPPLTAPSTTSTCYIPPLVNLATQPPPAQEIQILHVWSPGFTHKAPNNTKIVQNALPKLLNLKCVPPPVSVFTGRRLLRTAGCLHFTPPHTAQRSLLHTIGAQQIVGTGLINH